MRFFIKIKYDMKKRIITIFILSAFAIKATAQDENDALRFGMSQYFGTARGMAIGNATGSIGGDFSTLSVNPAGIGIYRKSEFSFTPNLYLTNKYINAHVTINPKAHKNLFILFIILQ